LPNFECNFAGKWITYWHDHKNLHKP
jgi:hypothetical protein